MPSLVGERKEKKGSYGKNKQVSLGKANGSLGEQMGDKNVCDNICLCGFKWPFLLL